MRLAILRARKLARDRAAADMAAVFQAATVGGA
jgi:hypothetical protein